MKKIIAILVFAFTCVAYGQAPQITQAQLEQSERTTKRINEFNDMLDKKVDAIMTAGNIDSKRRGELAEIVGTKESRIIRINRENISSSVKQSKIDAVNTDYLNQLEQFLGDKFSTVMQKLKL